MKTWKSMNYLSLIIMLLVAAILVIAGTAIVKQPQLLSNYHSFTKKRPVLLFTVIWKVSEI